MQTLLVAECPLVVSLNAPCMLCKKNIPISVSLLSLSYVSQAFGTGLYLKEVLFHFPFCSLSTRKIFYLRKIYLLQKKFCRHFEVLN